MLGIVSCQFNPARYQAPLRNWELWRRSLPADVPVSTVELSYDGVFRTDATIQLHGDERHIVWQKEALMNVAVRELPPEVDQVAWIDADILFDDRDWVERAEQQLESTPVIQLFSSIQLLGPDGTPEECWPGTVASGLSGWEAKSKPGYAWAARRDLIETYGLWPLAYGAGDVAFLHAVFGIWDNYWSRDCWSQATRRDWLDWGWPLYCHVQGQVGYLDVEVRHLYHGRMKHRHYDEREDQMRRGRLRPEHVMLQENGVLRWSESAPQELQEALKRNFLGRREDE